MNKTEPTGEITGKINANPNPLFFGQRCVISWETNDPAGAEIRVSTGTDDEKLVTQGGPSGHVEIPWINDSKVYEFRLYVASSPEVAIEISGNQCFDDQLTKTQTWGIILVGVSVHPDPRFPVKATEHVRIRENDLRGNLHSEGLPDESGAMTSSSHPTLPDDRTRAAIGRCVTHSSQ